VPGEDAQNIPTVVKSIVVLGMPRSATSLVGLGLQRAGVHIGEHLLAGDIANPLGYYENLEFKDLNERILFAAGGNIFQPPAEEKILQQYPKFKQEIIDTIARNTREPIWGWKEPRTTLTIRLYLPHLQNLHIISIFRNPYEVAKSLQRMRPSMSIKRGVAIANTYNSRLIKFLSEYYGA